eukprot:TRINITY_DN2988_c0_g2_i2.p1 TRINITY_DN2988_c0_g2~~TRINITY_DN2988_c0_g2_i2.p1  ORF type:complete len:951 (+),score=360.58 TRINITY_DN2988_c0_g2_i2:1658-4510(+)
MASQDFSGDDRFDHGAAAMFDGAAPPDDSASGFAHLVRTLRRLLPSVRGNGLGEKWRAVGDWCSRYEEDLDAAAVADASSFILGGGLAPTSPTRGAGSPGGTRRRIIAAACTSLDLIFAFLARAHPLLAPAAREVRKVLLNSCFSGPDAAAPAPVPAIWKLRKRDASEMNDALVVARQSYEGRHPLGPMVDALKSKLGAVAGDVESQASQIDKLMAVMYRGIGFWQNQLLKRLLRGWRAYMRFERAAARDRHAADRAARRVKEEAQQQAAKKQAQALAELQEDFQGKLEHMDQAMKKMRQEVEESRRRAVTAERHAEELELRFEGERKQLQLRVEDLVAQREEWREAALAVFHQHSFVPAWEKYRQDDLEQFAVVLGVPHRHDRPEQSAKPVDRQLLDWVNAMIALCRPEDSDRLHAESFMHGQHKLIDPYVVVMHCMAPELVSKEIVDQQLACNSDLLKAQMFLNAARLFGLDLPVEAAELVNPTSTPQHVLIVCLLFHRFADSGLASACGMPPCVPPADFKPPKLPMPQTPADISVEMEKAKRNIQKWRCAGARALSLAVEVMLAKIQNKDSRIVSEQERAQLAMFVHDALNEESLQRISDLLPREPEPLKAEVDALREVLLDSYRALRKVYIYYSTSDSRAADQEISPDEMWKLVTDAKVTNAKQGFSRVVIDDLNRKVLGNIPGGKVPLLNPTNYTIFLFRLADYRYPAKGVNATKPLSARLRLLLERHVLRHCNYVDIDDFRDEVYSVPVQAVISSRQDLVLATFNAYSKAAGPISFISKTRELRMAIGDFCEVVGAMNIIDGGLSFDAVRHVFLKIRDFECDSEPTVGEWTATYHEYVECLCCIAVYKFPAPFLPLARRLSRFFEMHFVPAFADSSQRKVREEYFKIIRNRKGARVNNLDDLEDDEEDGGGKPPRSGLDGMDPFTDSLPPDSEPCSPEPAPTKT